MCNINELKDHSTRHQMDVSNQCKTYRKSQELPLGTFAFRILLKRRGLNCQSLACECPNFARAAYVSTPYDSDVRSEHNSVRLLCLVFPRHKAHPRPRRRSADRLSTRHVFLLPFDEGLHVGGWDQPPGVAQLAKLPRPVVRPATSL